MTTCPKCTGVMWLRKFFNEIYYSCPDCGHTVKKREYQEIVEEVNDMWDVI